MTSVLSTHLFMPQAKPVFSPSIHCQYNLSECILDSTLVLATHKLPGFLQGQMTLMSFSDMQCCSCIRRQLAFRLLRLCITLPVLSSLQRCIRALQDRLLCLFPKHGDKFPAWQGRQVAVPAAVFKSRWRYGVARHIQSFPLHSQ